jgi:hypothetical protein
MTLKCSLFETMFASVVVVVLLVVVVLVPVDEVVAAVLDGADVSDAAVPPPPHADRIGNSAVAISTADKEDLISFMFDFLMLDL